MNIDTIEFIIRIIIDILAGIELNHISEKIYEWLK